jgi:iron complex outermembrane receptor protein
VPGLDRLGGPWVTPSRDFLIDQADTVRAFYGAAPGRVAEDPTRAFSQNENNSTLYLQGRWQTKLGGIDVGGTVGGRYCASAQPAGQQPHRRRDQPDRPVVLEARTTSCRAPRR